MRQNHRGCNYIPLLNTDTAFHVLSSLNCWRGPQTHLTISMLHRFVISGHVYWESENSLELISLFSFLSSILLLSPEIMISGEMSSCLSIRSAAVLLVRKCLEISVYASREIFSMSVCHQSYCTSMYMIIVSQHKYGIWKHSNNYTFIYSMTWNLFRINPQIKNVT